jgi:hypothetical protein
MSIDEGYVHDDHYVLVDHGLVIHCVLVVSVTTNGQFICQFHKLLVMNNDTMDTISSCAWLFGFVFFCCCIKGTLFLLFAREKRPHSKNTNSLLLHCSLSFPSWSCAHSNREIRPTKPAPFMSSSAWVKTNKERLPHDCSFDPQLPVLPGGGDLRGDRHRNSIIYTASSGTTTSTTAMSTSIGSGAAGYIYACATRPLFSMIKIYDY